MNIWKSSTLIPCLIKCIIFFRANGTCCHVVALLWGLCEQLERMEESACTDRPCVWSRPAKVSSSGVPIVDLDNTLEQEKKRKAHHSEFQPINIDVDPAAIRTAMLDLFRGSDALITTTLDDQFSTHTIYDMALIAQDTRDYDSFITKLKEVFTITVCDEIASITVNQSQNPLWRQYRTGRITSSKFKAAVTYKGDNVENSVVKTVFGRYADFSSEATIYGLDSEEPARKEYTTLHARSCHGQVSVKLTGFHINPDMPHLGASPDAIVDCSRCGVGILEIKSPYNKRNMSIQEACQDSKAPYVPVCTTVFKRNTTVKSSGFEVKPQSAWMYQVQGALLITRATYCDFVLYTQKETAMTRIYPSPVFQKQMKSRVDSFYQKFILPVF